MNFFYNVDLNLCGTEEDVIEIIVKNSFNGDFRHNDEVREHLESDREYEGWFMCNVTEGIFGPVEHPGWDPWTI